MSIRENDRSYLQLFSCVFSPASLSVSSHIPPFHLLSAVSVSRCLSDAAVSDQQRHRVAPADVTSSPSTSTPSISSVVLLLIVDTTLPHPSVMYSTSYIMSVRIEITEIV